MTELRIAHLYPDLLNLYGDRGNLMALKRRAELRGIRCTVTALNVGQSFHPEEYDFFFIGGGQDQDQQALRDDFLYKKGPAVKEAVLSGMPALCICGGYQLMGEYYKSANGTIIEGLGLIPMHTEAGERRMIGDLFCEASFLTKLGRDGLLIGFENHAGRTILHDTDQAMARVLHGAGNNGSDHTEGVVFQQLFGTYMHGSLLPKNPDFTDYLIECAMNKRYKDWGPLADADKSFEQAARDALISRYKSELQI